MKEYLYQFIPNRFLYLTKIKKISYKEKKLKTDYVINLINEFMIKFFFSNDLLSLKVNLWSIILRKKYGMNYNYYIDYLIDNGFIKMVSNYYVSKKTKTYQLNYFDVGKLMRVKIYDKILIKKFNKNYLERNITEYDNNPIPLKIKKKLISDIYRVDIDYDGALSYLKKLNTDNLIDDNKYYKNFLSINGIKDNHIFFKFDSYGRFHSNFTILKKEIRNKFLKIDGGDVCEIDIKNSQPFFLSLMIKKHMNDWNKFDDVNRYFFTANNGIIYDDIIENVDLVKNRNDAKLLVYKVLFGKNGDFIKSSKIFGKIYPNVLKFIQKYKIDKGDYKSMSHELQRIESDFIFNNIINKLMNEYPQIKIITIHDSIIFNCKYYNIVNDIFNNEFNLLKNSTESLVISTK